LDRPTCRQCRFFHPDQFNSFPEKTLDGEPHPRAGLPSAGECRLHPPRWTLQSTEFDDGSFQLHSEPDVPFISEPDEQWCGQLLLEGGE